VTVTAVIVNYNAGGILRGLVEALAAEQLVAGVVVVDNASVDGSVDFLAASSADTRVRLIRNDRNRGFAAGCNQGAALAHGSHILFINPDCRMRSGALAELLAGVEARPDAAMAGPLILNTDGSEQRGCRRYLPDPRRALARVLGFGGPDTNGRVAGFDLTGTPLPSEPVTVEAISGACMLMKREAFTGVGGWDEGYFLHCEDLDICKRFGLQGLSILFVPEAVVAHVQGVSSRGRSVFVLWHKHRGMWRYFGKFQRAASPLWLTGLVWFGIWSRFIMLLPGAWLASLGARRITGPHAA